MFGLTMKNKNDEKCKGAVFRAEARHFRTDRGFGFGVRLNKLSTLSCPGCRSCAWQSESFAEVGSDWPIQGIDVAEDKKLYIIASCNESRDFETGHIDSWDLKLIEYKEQKE